MNYFDIHSHLNFPHFEDDRNSIISEMNEKGIYTICVGTDEKTSRESIELAHTYENIWTTIGVHPTDWEEGYNPDAFGALAKERKVVGVGECGLDYYRDDTHKKEQEELFIQQIDLALTSHLPLMLHGRPSKDSMDAYEDMLDILLSYYNTPTSKYPGHIHFFAGNIDIARKFVERGFTIGFDGPITFAREYDEVIRYLPLDTICAETDAPFASPEPLRGRRNSPLAIPFIVGALARIRGEDIEKVQIATVENACRVFNITL